MVDQPRRRNRPNLSSTKRYSKVLKVIEAAVKDSGLDISNGKTIATFDVDSLAQNPRLKDVREKLHTRIDNSQKFCYADGSAVEDQDGCLLSTYQEHMDEESLSLDHDPGHDKAIPRSIILRKLYVRAVEQESRAADVPPPKSSGKDDGDVEAEIPEEKNVASILHSGKKFLFVVLQWEASDDGGTLTSRGTLQSSAFSASELSRLTLGMLRQKLSRVSSMSSFSKIHKFCTKSGLTVGEEHMSLEDYLNVEESKSNTTAALPTVTVVYKSSSALNQPKFDLSDMPGGREKMLGKIGLTQEDEFFRDAKKAKSFTEKKRESAIPDKLLSYASIPAMSQRNASMLTEEEWSGVLQNCGLMFGWVVDQHSNKIHRAPKAAFQLRRRNVDKDKSVQEPKTQELPANIEVSQPPIPASDSARTGTVSGSAGDDDQKSRISIGETKSLTPSGVQAKSVNGHEKPLPSNLDAPGNTSLNVRTTSACMGGLSSSAAAAPPTTHIYEPIHEVTMSTARSLFVNDSAASVTHEILIGDATSPDRRLSNIVSASAARYKGITPQKSASKTPSDITDLSSKTLGNTPIVKLGEVDHATDSAPQKDKSFSKHDLGAEDANRQKNEKKEEQNYSQKECQGITKGEHDAQEGLQDDYEGLEGEGKSKSDEAGQGNEDGEIGRGKNEGDGLEGESSGEGHPDRGDGQGDEEDNVEGDIHGEDDEEGKAEDDGGPAADGDGDVELPVDVEGNDAGEGDGDPSSSVRIRDTVENVDPNDTDMRMTLPSFVVNDDSRIEIIVSSHEFEMSMAINDFSKSSTEGSVSGGYQGFALNVTYGKSSSKSEISATTKNEYTKTMIAKYLLPRADVLLNPDDLEPTPALKEALERIRSQRNIKDLRNLHRDFGQIFCRKATIGGRLLSTKIMASTKSEQEQGEKEQFKTSIGVQLSTPIGFGGGVEHSNETGRTKGNNRTDINHRETNVFEAVGGNTILASNPLQWAATVANPNNWRTINRDNLTPIADLISLLEGWSTVRNDFIQAVSKLKAYYELPPTREIHARFHLNSPTTQLSHSYLASEPNYYYKPNYYLGHLPSSCVTPRQLTIKDERAFWGELKETPGSQPLFLPQSYRAPVIIGYSSITEDVLGSGSQPRDTVWKITAPFHDALRHGSRVILSTVPADGRVTLPEGEGIKASMPTSSMVVFRNQQGVFLPGMSTSDEVQTWRILKKGAAHEGEHIKAGDQVRLCWAFSDQTAGFRDFVDDVFGRRRVDIPKELRSTVLYMKLPWPRFEPISRPEQGSPIPNSLVMSTVPDETEAWVDIKSVPGAMRGGAGIDPIVVQDVSFRMDAVTNDGEGDGGDYLFSQINQQDVEAGLTALAKDKHKMLFL